MDAQDLERYRSLMADCSDDDDYPELVYFHLQATEEAGCEHQPVYCDDPRFETFDSDGHCYVDCDVATPENISFGTCARCTAVARGVTLAAQIALEDQVLAQPEVRAGIARTQTALYGQTEFTDADLVGALLGGGGA